MAIDLCEKVTLINDTGGVGFIYIRAPASFFTTLFVTRSPQPKIILRLCKVTCNFYTCLDFGCCHFRGAWKKVLKQLKSILEVLSALHRGSSLN